MDFKAIIKMDKSSRYNQAHNIPLFSPHVCLFATFKRYRSIHRQQDVGPYQHPHNTDDPRKNPDAKPIDSISWADFRAMVGDEWVPGKNAPFDPIASRLAQEAGIRVICADGRNTENTLAILNGEAFEGTVIGD